MKSTGFIISHKENENRRALLPEDIEKLPSELIPHIYIEEGYGKELGIGDEDYASKGVKIAPRDEILKKTFS